MNHEKIRIALVDDHKIVRDGIKAMLLPYEEIEVVAETADAETMQQMIKGIIPVMLILDIMLPGMNGNQLACYIHQNFPEVKILVMSSDLDEHTILESIKAGVKGYISKEASVDEFILAIKTIFNGNEYFSEKISSIIFKSYKARINENGDFSGEHLSEREKEVLEGFANGLSYKEIGAQLSISPRTVESHRNSIMEKLNLQTLADLIKYAIRNGIIKL